MQVALPATHAPKHGNGKFEVGGVYQVYANRNLKFAVKVTRISAKRKSVWFRDSSGGTGDMGGSIDDKEKRSKIADSYSRYEDEPISSEMASFAYGKGMPFCAITFHRLHPFFPNKVFLGYADQDDFHKETIKTFVLFFFSIRLIVLARRVKERMYAPPNMDCENDMGGLGFIAAEENFDRAANSQRIE